MTQPTVASSSPPSLPEASPPPAGSRPAFLSGNAFRDFLLPSGEPPQARADLTSFFGSPRRLARRERLYRTGDGFAGPYLIRVGSLKSVALVDGGREQIIGYAMAGDIVGIEGLGLASHTCDVLALEDSEVSLLSPARLEEVTRQPDMLRALFERMVSDLRRAQELIVLLGSLRAEERVATFLLDLAHRHWARGYSATQLVLRMTREEIASFLGLKLETVSRIFSRLHAEGLIDVRGRQVGLHDIEGLRRVAGQAG